MTFQEHNDALLGIHRATLVTLDQTLAQRDALASELVTTKSDLAKANARIKVLEAQLATTTRTTTQPPTTTRRTTTVTPPPPPLTKPPAILDVEFKNGVDWNKFYAEEGDDAADRAKFVQTADGLKTIWIAGSPTGTKRTELGIRAVPGGGETPRRDPVGSDRWYGIEFMIPLGYTYTLPDEKRVLWQAHQGNSGGIVNPPLSLELRNGTFRLIRSVLNDAREEILDPDDDPDGLPMVKGAWNRMVLHVNWHATSGSIEAWFNTKHISKITRKTCNPVTDGLNIKVGSYFPGATSFTNGYRHEHFIRHWTIGNQTNALADMLAAFA